MPQASSTPGAGSRGHRAAAAAVVLHLHERLSCLRKEPRTSGPVGHASLCKQSAGVRGGERVRCGLQ